MIDWTHPGGNDPQEKSIKAVSYEEVASLHATTDVPCHAACLKHTAMTCLGLQYWRPLIQLLLKGERENNVRSNGGEKRQFHSF